MFLHPFAQVNDLIGFFPAVRTVLVRHALAILQDNERHVVADFGDHHIVGGVPLLDHTGPGSGLKVSLRNPVAHGHVAENALLGRHPRQKQTGKKRVFLAARHLLSSQGANTHGLETVCQSGRY